MASSSATWVCGISSLEANATSNPALCRPVQVRIWISTFRFSISVLDCAFNAVKIPLAAQEQLLADRGRRGIDGIVQAVDGQHLHPVRIAQHHRAPFTADQIDA